MSRSGSSCAVGAQAASTALVSCSKPVARRPTSLATIRSSALRGELVAAGVGDESSVSAAKPTSIWPGRLRSPSAAQDVGRRLEHELGDAVVLLELAVGDGLRAGSRRRRRPSRPRRRRRPRAAPPARISLGGLDATRRRHPPARPDGSGRDDERDLGAAAGGLRGDRVALLPVQRLPMKRTGSIGSRVRPGGDDDPHARRGRAGADERARPRRQRCRRARRAGRAPSSPPASAPDTGSTSGRRARRSVATFSGDGGVLPHLGVHRRAPRPTGRSSRAASR